jgi:hypothetical protein
MDQQYMQSQQYANYPPQGRGSDAFSGKAPVACSFFTSPQGCRFGDQCRNIHDYPDGPQFRQPAKIRRSQDQFIGMAENTDE